MDCPAKGRSVFRPPTRSNREMCGTLLYDVNPEIEFDGSGADPVVAGLIEGHVKKATEALRCVHHFSGSISIRVDSHLCSIVFHGFACQR
jgi:hypothetical protein